MKFLAPSPTTVGGGGAGDVIGPGGSTDGAAALFNGTTGKLLKDSTLVDTGSGDFQLTGRLGIGTAPSYPLHLLHTGAAYLYFNASSPFGISGIYGVNDLGYSIVYTLYGSTYVGVETASLIPRANLGMLKGHTNLSSFMIRSDGGHPFYLVAGNYTAITIDGTNQYVAIGSDHKTPTAELDVSGDIVVSGTVDGVDVAAHDADADAHHNESHAVASHSDTAATGTELNELVGGGVTALHSHSGGAGTGDVVGPAGATDHAAARYDTTTGKLLQNSVVTIDDSGNIATPGTVDGVDVAGLDSDFTTHEADANAHHAESHTVASHSDTSATGAELNTLTGGGSTALHSHAAPSIAHADTTGKTANDHHNESHTVVSHSDTTATGTELEELTDGSETTLHSHAMEYMYPIYAEENSALNASTYEWAYGNGANTPSGSGIPIYVPSGWDCAVVAMSLSINGTGDATVQLDVNGTPAGASYAVTVEFPDSSNVNEFGTPYSLSDGDVVNFYTSAQVLTAGPCHACLWIKMTPT